MSRASAFWLVRSCLSVPTGHRVISDHSSGECRCLMKKEGDRMYIIRQSPKRENDVYDSKNSWTSRTRIFLWNFDFVVQTWKVSKLQTRWQTSWNEKLPDDRVTKEGLVEKYTPLMWFSFPPFPVWNRIVCTEGQSSFFFSQVRVGYVSKSHVFWASGQIFWKYKKFSCIWFWFHQICSGSQSPRFLSPLVAVSRARACTARLTTTEERILS